MCVARTILMFIVVFIALYHMYQILLAGNGRDMHLHVTMTYDQLASWEILPGW